MTKEMYPLLSFWSLEPGNVETMRQTVVLWRNRHFYFRERAGQTHFEPSATSINTDFKPVSGLGIHRCNQVIRLAFYDVRNVDTPILVIDGLGITASFVAFSRRSVFLRVVMRTSLAEPSLENVGLNKFIGPVFDATLTSTFQDIEGDANQSDNNKTTALFTRVVIADRDRRDIASPARYQPVHPDPSEAERYVGPKDDSGISLPAETPNPIPPNPNRPIPPQPKTEDSIPPVSWLGLLENVRLAGGLLSDGIVPLVHTVAVKRRKAGDGFSTTRVADLVGHSRMAERPRSFPAEIEFDPVASIPFAQKLGIDRDVDAARLRISDIPYYNHYFVDDPHWTRRLTVSFERGPTLPHEPRIRTIEVAIRREFYLKRSIVFSNSDTNSFRAEAPIHIVLNQRGQLDARNGERCQTVDAQYRFLERQPPLYCAERQGISDAIPALVAIENLGGEELKEIWNRDIAGRYLSSVSSIRQDRRLSLFPNIDKIPRSEKTLRLCLIFSIKDGRALLDEPDRFDHITDRLNIILWRLDEGDLIDVCDRALAYLSKTEERDPERNSAKHDGILLKVLDGLGDQTIKPERVHLGGALDACGAGIGRSRPDQGILVPDTKRIGRPSKWNDIAAFKNSAPHTFEGSTRLFVDAFGNPLDLFFNIQFVVPLDNEAGQGRRPDLRLRIADLRMYAGIGGTQMAPTGTTIGEANVVRPPFIGFQINQVQVREPASGSNSSKDETGPNANVGIKPAIRLGAYDIFFKRGEDVEDDGIGWLAVWLAPLDYRSEGDSHSHQLHTAVQYSLPVEKLSPGTQDDPSDARIDATERPLLIPLNTGEKNSSTQPLVLRLTETAHHLQKQKIRFELRGKRLPSASVVVFDTHPIFIGRVEIPEINTGDSTALAFWDSDEGESSVWRQRREIRGYTLTLPSQGTGEEVVRQGGKNITDIGYGLGEGHVADFRFAPPARLVIGTDPRFSERREAEPPFNTRRIFGNANDVTALGAPLFQAEFELLYGMATKFEAERNFVLREIGSEIGAPPAPINELSLISDFSSLQSDRKIKTSTIGAYQRKAFERKANLWSETLKKLAARPAMLAFRNRGQNIDGKLTTGVSYRMRDKADIAKPADLGDNTQRTPYRSDGTRSGDERKKSWGGQPLEGGADAGIESPNIYRELWRDPESIAGEMSEVMLSPYGGYGNQRAFFSQGKLRIIARVTQGRTHFYSVERIGRIACLWHRAKHVVIYERTVSGTRQFEATQPALTGIPALRKVREYIEILQPERNYPEDGEKPARCGCFESVRFDALIIPVDSTWGSYVGDIGWEMPLWQLAAQAQGYVKPPVDAKLSTDPRSGRSSRLCRILNPQELRFFTSTRDEDTDETDTWPRFPGVDCAMEPELKPRPQPAYDEANIDAVLPGEEPVAPGFERFTLMIETANGGPINIGARRTNDPMVARLANVTIGRGTLPNLSDKHAEIIRGAIAARAILNDELRNMNGIIAGVSGTPKEVKEEIAKRLKAEAARVEKRLKNETAGVKDEINRFKGILDDIDNPSENLCKKLKTKLESETGKLTSRLETEAQKLEGQIASQIRSSLSLLVTPLAQLKAAIKKLEDASGRDKEEARKELEQKIRDFKSVIEGVFAQVAGALPGSITPFHAYLRPIEPIDIDLNKAISAPIDRIVDEIKDFKTVQRELATLERLVADQTRTAVRALDQIAHLADRAVRIAPEAVKDIRKVRAAITEIRREITALKTELDAGIAELRRIDINKHEGVNEKLSSLSKAANRARAITEALNNELNEILTGINNEIRKLRDGAIGVENDANDALGKTSKALNDAREDALSDLGAFKNKADTWLENLGTSKIGLIFAE